MLDERQREITTNLDNPMLVIAGAGSGKTLCLVTRVCNILINQKANPENIIITTFTDKAAKELMLRINEKLKEDEINIDINNMYIGTMHSIWKRFIEENIDRSHFLSSFKIFENDDEQLFFISKRLKFFKELDYYSEFLEEYKLRNSILIARELKNKFNMICEYALDIKNIFGLSKVMIFLQQAFKLYEEFLIKENIMDFSYLQLEFLNMLKYDENFLKQVNNQIDYVMVDEYQDSNKIQEQILFLITKDKNNLCVVGDEDQAIYRFRGATVENILNFESNYQKKNIEVKKIFLNVNYRSANNIVEFSKKFIESKNWGEFRNKKEIYSSNIDNSKNVFKITTNDSKKNAKILSNFIKKLKDDNKISNYNQVVVLFSSFRDSFADILEKQLNLDGIGVYSPRARKFFQREEIKTVIGILLAISKNIYHINNDKYYLSCLDCARAVSKQDKNLLDYIVNNIENNKTFNISQILYDLFQFKYFKNIISIDNIHTIENRSLYNLAILSKIFNKYQSYIEIQKNKDDVDKIITYFFNVYLNKFIESGISEFEDAYKIPDDKVQFLTIHQAKGLEFSVVIVSSLYENVKNVSNEPLDDFDFLIHKDLKITEKLNSEFDIYRKFYVAFTRAKNILILTGNDNRISKIFKPLLLNVPSLLNIDNNVDVKIDTYQKQNFKEILSYTKNISIYNVCPLKYFFNVKIGFISDTNKKIELGIISHKFIEHINKMFKNKEKNEITYDKTVLTKLLKRVIYSLNADISKNEFDNIIEITKNYLNKEIDTFKYMSYVEATEYKIYDNFILYGEIDIVVEKNNEIEIIDLKTGAYNEKLLQKYEEQLAIYRILLENKYNKKIKTFLIYLEDKKYKIEIKISDKQLQFYKEKIENTIKNILSENYNSIFYDEQKCKNCDFFIYCNSEVEDENSSLC